MLRLHLAVFLVLVNVRRLLLALFDTDRLSDHRVSVSRINDTVGVHASLECLAFDVGG